MKRRIARCTLILTSAIALLVAARMAQHADAERQISGRLTFDTAQLSDRAFEVGAFHLRWTTAHGGTLEITHRDDTQRILWSSLAGQSFIAAAQGVETVTEARGMFFLRDRLNIRCADQRLESLAIEGDVALLRGQLRCDDGTEASYTLRFDSQGRHQLGFKLTLADPRLNRTYLTYASEPDEHIFGFGAQFSHFDLKGRRVPLFVMEQGIGRGAQPITIGADLQARAGGAWHTSYAGVPHYMTSKLRSLFLETYEYAVFDLRRADRIQIQLWAPRLTGRILYGDSPVALIGEYTAVAGRMRPLPDWIHKGAVVGMQGGTARVREVWRQLRAHDTPIAAFWLQDWVGQRTTSFGKQLWWNWELDRDRYPNWEELRADLAASDIRIMTYINPFLVDVTDKPNHRRHLFREAAEANYLVKNSESKPYLILNTDFSAGLLDLTNPAARAWMIDVIQNEVIGAGVSGWMADFGEALPYDAQLHSGEAAASYHNRYPEAWAQLNREAIEASGHGSELVAFHRSGYRHSPAYATLFWLGDQLVSWDEHDGIKTAVTGLLSSGMSGFSLSHSDIGGYTTITNPIRNYHRSKELLLRWIELNAFTTVFRTHEGNRPDENVQFYSDDETLAHFSRFARIYRAWSDYRRALVEEAATTGLPVVRHPFIHYPDDPQVYRLSYQQFMLGREFMIAPVLDPDREQIEVYLPAGRWTHLWSGTTHGDTERGAWITIAAPLGQPAVFYREGSTVGAHVVEQLRADGLLMTQTNDTPHDGTRDRP